MILMEDLKNKCIRFFKNLNKCYYVTFFATFFWGIIAHGYAMTNASLMYFDNLVIDRVGATFTSGRWFLGLLGEKGLVGKLFGTYNLPLLAGFFFLFWIALSNVMIVNMFKISGLIQCFVVSGILVTFPSAISLFGYTYTISYYAFAIFLAVFSVWITTLKVGKKYIVGPFSIIILACSLGIYQAYIGFAIILFLLVLVSDIIGDNDKKIKDYFLKGIYYICILALSLLFYAVINKIFLKALKVKLVDYQNISSMYDMSLNKLLAGIKCAYINFFNPYYDIFPEKTKCVFWIFLFLSLGLFLVHFVKLIVKKRYLDSIVLVIVIFLLPLGINSIYLIDAQAYYNLMLYPAALLFLIPLLLLKKISQGYVKFFIGFCLSVIILYQCSYCVSYSNRCYMDAEYKYLKTVQWMNALVSRIKSQDGYRQDMKIMFLRDGEVTNDLTFNLDTEYDVEIYHYGSYDIRTSYNWTVFMKKWCGFEMQQVTYDEYKYLLSLEEVQNMPFYPNDGSILIIDNFIVVRF